MIRALLLAALLAVPASAQTYVTRHYDTPQGERDPALLPQGTARAEALQRWFGKRPLTAIYVTPFARTAATVAPLAKTRGIVPKTYGPAVTPELLAELKAAKGPMLIVGHSNTVPDIVAGLGGEKPAPLSHPDFGDLWVIDKGKSERVMVAPN